MFIFFFRSEYIFKFDDKFEMHDDAEVLKRMGLLYGKFFEKKKNLFVFYFSFIYRNILCFKIA